MQTSTLGTFPTTLRGAFPKVGLNSDGYSSTFTTLLLIPHSSPQMLKEGGVGIFYKSLVPLWGRQIPYTMMKFACFERTVRIDYFTSS